MNTQATVPRPTGQVAPIVSRTFANSKRHLSKRRIIILLIIIVVAVVAFFVVRSVMNRHLSSTALSTQFNSLVAHHNYDEARSLLAKQSDYHSRSYQELYASTYIAQGNTKQALKVLLAAQKQYGADYTLTQTIAEQYDALGDKTQAIAYYNKTIQLFTSHPPKGPTSDDAIEGSRLAIQRLSQ